MKVEVAMKNNALVLFISVSLWCQVVAEESRGHEFVTTMTLGTPHFEFEEEDDNHVTPLPPADSPIVDLAKDVAATIAQRILKLYLFIRDLISHE